MSGPVDSAGPDRMSSSLRADWPDIEELDDVTNHVAFSHADGQGSRPAWSQKYMASKPPEEDTAKRSRYWRRVAVTVSSLLLFLVVLCSNIVAKLSLATMAADVYNRTDIWSGRGETGGQRYPISPLFICVFIPQCWNFVWALWNFIVRPTRANPWPPIRAVLATTLAGIGEGAALAVYALEVVPTLPPAVSLTLTMLVFAGPAAWHMVYVLCFAHRRTEIKRAMLTRNGHQPRFAPLIRGNDRKTTGMMTAGFVIQILLVPGLCVCVVLWHLEALQAKSNHTAWQVALAPIVVIILSVVWSHGVLERIHRPTTSQLYRQRQTWVKGSFLFCLFRLGATLAAALVCCVIRHTYSETATSVNTLFARLFDFFIHPFMPAVSHIVAGFIGYTTARVACIVGLQQPSFALPLTLSTPISAILLGVAHWIPFSEVFGIGTMEIGMGMNSSAAVISVLIIIVVLAYASQQAVTARSAWNGRIPRLALDKTLFHVPAYNSLFLEQFTLLNRKSPDYDEMFADPVVDIDTELRRSRIFICTTMFQEVEEEMRQLINSLLAVDRDMGHGVCETIESHVFLDGGIKNGGPGKYALQLLRVLRNAIRQETLKHREHFEPMLSKPDALKLSEESLKSFQRLITPYGHRMELRLPNGMFMAIHLKDNSRVKNKKRWSQVMYMHYLLQMRCHPEQTPADAQCYLLATDADVNFKSKDIVALLTLLARDPRVGAVCGRTFPLGNGPLVWYQIFDYAVGHWFQKAAEHVLGSVLCCPGCFSMFRLSELRKVVDEYSSSVQKPFDHLIKDMGEDRWLCTLMVLSGCRLDYCAAASDSTYCPDSFKVFFDQRRRWISSTVANIVELLSKSGTATRNNDSITFAFMAYQALMLFSTVVCPATVLLVVMGGLHYALGWNLIAINVILFSTTLGFVLICLLVADRKVHIAAARILTALYAIIMGIVIVGLAAQVAEDLTPKHATTIPPTHMPHNKTTHTTKPPMMADADDAMAAWTTAAVEMLTPNVSTTAASSSFSQQVFASASWWTHIHIGGGHNSISVSTVYLLIIIGIFLAGGMLHLAEVTALLHGIWYLLCLPGGYLFLLIYSCCNMDDRSWGTRVGDASKSQGSVDSWTDFMLGCGREDGESLSHFLGRLLFCRTCGKDDTAPHHDQDPDLASPTSPYQLISDNDQGRNGSEWYITYSGRQPRLRSRTLDKFASQLQKELSMKGEAVETGAKLVTLAQRSLKECPELRLYHVGHWCRLVENEDEKDAANSLRKDDVRAMLETVERTMEKLSDIPVTPSSGLAPYVSHATVQSLDDWLERCDIDSMYVSSLLQEHGYDDTTFLATLTLEDLDAIGISRLPQGRAVALRLAKYARQLPEEYMPENLPPTISQWLAALHLDQYIPSFRLFGYRDFDITLLENLSEEEIRNLGITKRGHRKKLQKALNLLNMFCQQGRKPETSKQVEALRTSAQDWAKMHFVEALDLSLFYVSNNFENEQAFWNDVIDTTLDPKLSPVENVDKLPERLRSLKLRSVLAMVLVNAVWLVLMLELAGSSALKLQVLGTNPLGLVFLAIYGFVFVIQFLAMLVHRAETLLQYIAGLTIDTRKVSRQSLVLEATPLLTDDEYGQNGGYGSTARRPRGQSINAQFSFNPDDIETIGPDDDDDGGGSGGDGQFGGSTEREDALSRSRAYSNSISSGRIQPALLYQGVTSASLLQQSRADANDPLLATSPGRIPPSPGGPGVAQTGQHDLSGSAFGSPEANDVVPSNDFVD